jgi:hypothetical protein
MNEIIRNRKIRPSTRLETSLNYKIDTEKVTVNDLLIVNITHESNSFSETYHFKGSDVYPKKSISFRVHDDGSNIKIVWSGAIPQSLNLFEIMNKCANCDSGNNLEANFCSTCGHVIDKSANHKVEKTKIDFTEIEENLKDLISMNIDYLIISKDDFYVQFSGRSDNSAIYMEAVSEVFNKNVKGKKKFLELGFELEPDANYVIKYPFNVNSIPLIINLIVNVFTNIYKADLRGYKLDNSGRISNSKRDEMLAKESNLNDFKEKKRVRKNNKPTPLSFKLSTKAYFVIGLSIFFFIGAERIKCNDNNRPQHVKDIENQFDHFNGSHIKVTNYIKSQMNNPSSFEHVQSKYIDETGYLLIIETYRGTNSFGAVVTNTVKAKVDMSGNIIEVIESLPY